MKREPNTAAAKHSQGDTAQSPASAARPLTPSGPPAGALQPTPKRRNGSLRSVLLALLLAPTLALAAAGKVTHVSGPFFAMGTDGSKRVLAVGSEVSAGDTLITEGKTYARIKFADQGDVTLRPDTQMKVESYAFNQAKPDEDSAVLSLFKGALRTLTGLIGKRGNKDAYRLSTATATIGIRGTTFGATVCPGPACAPDMAPGTYVNVADGAIQVGGPTGGDGLLVSAGQFGYVPPAGTPQLLPTDPGLIPRFTPPPGFTEGGGSGQPCEVR